MESCPHRPNSLEETNSTKSSSRDNKSINSVQLHGVCHTSVDKFTLLNKSREEEQHSRWSDGVLVLLVDERPGDAASTRIQILERETQLLLVQFSVCMSVCL